MKKKMFFKNYLLILLAAFSSALISCNKDDDDDPVLEPTITSVSPAEAAVGEQVTITGTNLANANFVTFGSAAAVVESNSETSIVTTVPADAPEGDLTITVTTAGGSATHDFTVTTDGGGEGPDPEGPEITSINPESGYMGDEVTITGTNFEGATLDFSGTTVEPVSVTATEIVFIVPEVDFGPKIVSVIGEGGAVAEADFRYEERWYVYQNGVVNEEDFGHHGGWNAEVDLNSTDQSFSGEQSLKIAVFKDLSDGWAGFHGADYEAGAETAGYTHVRFSAYGAEGAGNIRFALRDKAHKALNAIVYVEVEVVEGEWTTFEIPLADLGYKVPNDGSGVYVPGEHLEEWTPSGIDGPFTWEEMRFLHSKSTGEASLSTYYIDEVYFLNK